MRHLLLLSAVLGACTFSGRNDPSNLPVDGAPVDVAIDGPDEPPPINLAPFGTPTLITALSNPAFDDDPTLTGDLLEIYFNSTRAGGSGQGDIWFAVRDTMTSPWSVPSPVTAANTGSDESAPEVSSDGLTLWFASNRPGVGDDDLWMVSRPNRNAAWSQPALVTVLNTTSIESSPGIDTSGLVMLLSSTRGGGVGYYDLYLTTRATSDAPWSTPVELTELNTTAYEASAVPSQQGRVIYFSSSRLGSASEDLYRAVRPSGTGPYETPQPIAELNGPGIEADPWLSEDARYIAFCRDGEIYEARR